MSGLYGDDEEGAAEKLQRAGIASRRTILAALPKDSDGEINRPQTPREIVKDRFPKPHQMMPTYELRELGPGLREEFERFIREHDEREAEELQRDWECRLLFDPRPLSREPKRFVPRPLQPSRYANRAGRGRSSA
jgi:hypothetical protein